MKTLIAFILLLIPSSAFAFSTFNVSCSNVRKIYIISTHMRLSPRSNQDQFYIVRFVLKPGAVEGFKEKVKASRNIFIKNSGVDYDREELIITSNGTPLRNDEPDVDAHGDGEAAVTIRNEQDAFDAARSVCPALTPTTVTTYGP